MDLNALGNTSFFRKPSSDAKGKRKVSLETENGNPVQAAQAIQLWWKQVHLKETAKESSRYINRVVSLQQAKEKPISKLEAFILDKNTQETTRRLLMHLEQAKDLMLPERNRAPELKRPERVFLSAYLIATKSEHIFESPTDIDGLLLKQSVEMLQLFEELCRFMGETYMEKVPNQVDSPMAKSTPSSDQIFANIEQLQLNQSRERMEKDQRFMSEGRACLETFHNAQIAYYETFNKWESENRHRLAKMCIAQYVLIETKRFAIFNNPDPRQLELYEGYGSQQETLRGKIDDLLGEEGLKLLTQELEAVRAALEASKWVSSPSEVLAHEMALNPDFTYPPELSNIRPKKDINAAIAALDQNPADAEPMLGVLEEIRDHIAFLSPHNEKRIKALQHEFSKQAITDKIASLGLEPGLYQVICSIIEKIKQSESPAHVPETTAFQNELEQNSASGAGTDFLMEKAINFIYRKFSQINQEIMNFSRSLVAGNIVEYEQKNFYERLQGGQFNLATVLALIDGIVDSPTHYRLNTSVLCSQYIASHVAHIICLAVLQKPGSFDLHAVPETFYLDRGRLVDWHGKYQRIFYTAAAMGFLEIFCQKYGAKLSAVELLEQKTMLISTLESENLTDPKEVAAHVVCILNVLLSKKGKRLAAPEEKDLTKICEDICMGNHRVAEIMNKRLGDQLSFYFLKGYLPDASASQGKLYGVEKELSLLGKEIIPLLRLHVKVHGAFYKRSIENRLWKPLFTVLTEAQKPRELPPLLAPGQESIETAQTNIHKMAFLLAGLTLIQQTFAYSDMWGMVTKIKHAVLKDLDLIQMLNDLNEKVPDLTKLQQSKLRCQDLLKDIEMHKFGDNDNEMGKFINTQRELISRATTNAEMTQLQLNLQTTLTQLEADPVSRELRNISQSFRDRKSWKTFSMNIKAKQIEMAIGNVPVEERANIHNGGKGGEEVLKVLAARRKMGRIVDVKNHPSTSYKKFQAKFQSHITESKQKTTTSKELEEKLVALVRHVAEEQKHTFDEGDEQKIARMIREKWNLGAGIEHGAMKDYADSFGLIQMVLDPNVSKDQIETKLMDLMKHLAGQVITIDEIDEQKMARMLRLAKNNKSPGCKAFLEEIVGTSQQFTKQEDMPALNSNPLMAEFTEEVGQICTQVKRIVTDIKQAQMPDDVDPVAQIIPTVRAGRSLGT